MGRDKSGVTNPSQRLTTVSVNDKTSQTILSTITSSETQ